MKKNNIPFIILVMAIASYSSAILMVGHTPYYTNRSDRYGIEHGITPALQRYERLHRNIFTGKVELQDGVRAFKEFEKIRIMQSQMKSTSGADIGWQEMGPDNVGGRTRAILFDRNNHNRIYAGQVSGGLWISDNGGISWKKWEPVSGPAWMPVTCLAQGNNGIIYAGTGENLGIGCSSCPSGHISGNTMFPGSGIWKSDDNNGFTPIPSTVPALATPADPWSSVQRIAVDPVNPQKIYAAIYGGIRISFDGGGTWFNPVGNIICSPQTGKAYDIKVTTGGLVFASFRSTPWYSPDGDTAHTIIGVTENSGTLVTTASPHGFSAGQVVYHCGINLPSPYKGRQYVTQVKSNIEYYIAASFSGYGTGKASSWIPINDVNDSIYNLNTAGSSRIEFGVSPTFPNYVYCSVADDTGDSLRIYISSDRGRTWRDAGMNLPIGPQGEYNNVIASYPDAPEKIIAGAVWFASNEYGAWDYHSANIDVTGDGTYYTHPDKHAIVFHPDYLASTEKKIFYGTDGGIFMSKTVNGKRIFQPANRNYATVQFYGLAIGNRGEVFGGTQDNGNPFIDPFVNLTGIISPMGEDYNLPSGDGGNGEISIINPDVFIWESQYGFARRSPDRGRDGGAEFFPWSSAAMSGLFITPFTLWESFNDTNSTEYIRYITDSNEYYEAGDVLAVPSRNHRKIFMHQTDSPVGPMDTLMVRDIVQAKFFIVINQMYSDGYPKNFYVWMTKDILDFSITPSFQKIFQLTGTYEEAQLECSADGRRLFVSRDNDLYRIDGIEKVIIPPGGGESYDTVSTIVTPVFLHHFDALITDIAVDPGDANNVMVVLGQYNMGSHIFRSGNALGASPVFDTIQGASSYAIPDMPVYSALIEKHDRNRVFVGTEYGIFYSENAFDPVPGNVKWLYMINGMSVVPVYRIRQQVNPQYVSTVGYTDVQNEGTVYIATHGRGIFRSETFSDPLTVKPLQPAISSRGLTVFPNPVRTEAVISFTLQENAGIHLAVYDITGRMVKTLLNGKLKYGKHDVMLNVSELGAGNYFVAIDRAGQILTKKIIVLK